MLKKIFLIIIFIGMGSLSAQSFKGKISLHPTTRSGMISSSDTLKILAVMVDFQEDTDGSTFGNGKFGSLYTRDYGIDIIDPLPHDADYFRNHFVFLENYYKKVSHNQLIIDHTILPEIITVSKTMRNYSPPPRSEDLTTVAEFAQEVWKLADSTYPSFNFSEYDVFFILHAGAGRDITLPGSLGNERDLPSLYFGPLSFEKLLPDFSGFPAGPGDFKIMNSAIIPETESRELSSLGSTFLFELSINGLLAATVASHLGLPDLFDTETGLSAIGRFGLMDGQAIFAYNGLFPPEPSAWEKIYLGWEIPVSASLQKLQYSLVPSLIPGNDTTILRIDLSSSEYFLIENRQRDVNSDGAAVTYISAGEVKTKSFEKDTTGFYSFNVDSLEGVVIDVDEYDWALPGSGIVIWHIDENIIEQKIAENKINADPVKRGVDVEEADGIQDTGVEFQTIFGDIIIGEGEQRDLWYASNDADLYINKFAKDTRPDTRTNTGANSLITISGFSEISNRMSFNVSRGDSIITPVLSTKLTIEQGTVTCGSVKNGLLNVTTSSRLQLIDATGNQVSEVTDFSLYKPAVHLSGDTVLIAGVNEGVNTFITFPAGSGSTTKRLLTSSMLTSNPVIDAEKRRIAAGATNGKVYLVSFQDLNGIFSLDSIQLQSTGDIIYLATGDAYYSAIAESNGEFTFLDNQSAEVPLDIAPSGLMLTKNMEGDYTSVVLSDQKIVIITNGAITAVINKDVPYRTGAALFDLKQDGSNYIAINDGNYIKVYNLNGYPADNFPFDDPSGYGFDEYVLASDFEGNKSSEIIAVTRDGRIFAIDGSTGKSVYGFPITAGRKLRSCPILYNNAGSTFLTVLDSSANLYTWNISSVPGTLYWSEQYGNPHSTSFTAQPKNDNYLNTFFPKERVYNYPNPAYDDKTYIRYYVAEHSKINIRIFDLAGALVDELNTNASGGADNEILWDLSSVQSGIYLARVEATGASGKKEFNIIKIAVVK